MIIFERRQQTSLLKELKRFVFYLGICFSYTVCSQNLSIHFDFGSSQIPNPEKKRLDSLLKRLDPEARYKVKLVGHTDSIGTHENNLDLSEKRASALKTFLSKSPVEMHFETLGLSFKKPLQKNDSDEGMALNRRCDIYLEVIPESLPEWETHVTVYPLDPNKKSVLYTKSGCQVIVAPGSFPVQAFDTVEIHITEYNDPIDFLVGGLPMSYEQNGKTYMYESEQMMKIEAFINNHPVKLIKLIGLKCPHLDTSRGVKFYEFKGQKPKTPLGRSIKGFGRIDYLSVEDTPEKEELANRRKENTSTFNDAKKITSKPAVGGAPKREQIVKHEKEEVQGSRSGSQGLKIEDVKSKDKSNGKDLELEPDTGWSFILKPDTGRVFRFYSKYKRDPAPKNEQRYGNNDYHHHCYECNKRFCDSSTFFDLVARGVKGINNDSLNAAIDFRFYYERYRNLGYDGMVMKPQKSPDRLFSVKTKFKKRFLRRDLILTIASADENPEYEPLMSTKWILHYGRRRHKLPQLKAIKISDLRILQYKGKNNFLMELKADTMFYAFEAKAKKSKEVLLQYKNYLKLYEKRVRKFDDSLQRYFDAHEEEIEAFLCMFQFTNELSNEVWRMVPCFDSDRSFPACYPFSFFNEKYEYEDKEGRTHGTYSNCKGIVELLERHRKNNTIPSHKEVCASDCFGDWLNYYRAREVELKEQFLKIQQDSLSAWKCKCAGSYSLNTSRKLPCPDSVWRPDGIGDEITYIGLGVYNFDRKMALENTQAIPYPVYLNRNNDTILKCDQKDIRFRTNKLFCRHQTYSIIPGYNGLLQQVYNESLTLVLGKINVLFFVDPTLNKYYKLRLDLRYEKKPIRQTTFKLKDITKQASSVESLRKELLKE